MYENMLYTKLDRRLDYPSDASLKERFRSTVAMSQANGESDLHDLSWAVIREVYGKITESDFDSISAMAAFFADKRCIIREILDEAMRGSGPSGSMSEQWPLIRV